MDQRVAFIADWLRDEWTMSDLAHRYGISRKTAYKWVERYEGRSGARISRSQPGGPKQHRTRDGGRDAGRGAGRCGARIPAGVRRSYAPSCGTAPRDGRGRRRARWGICCAARGSEPAAPSHALHRPADATVGGRHRAERRVDGGFQRLVSHRGWDALRSPHDGGRVQPIRVVLPDRVAGRISACGRGLSGRFASMGCRAPSGPTTGRPSRRRAGAALAVGGLVAQAGHSGRSN